MENEAKVLMVDDDIEMTETLSDVPTDLSHHIETANDGPKVIKKVKAKTQTFSVILVDSKMPGMNGVEIFKEIKHIQPEAAVMMTAYSVEDLITEALEEGAYGVWYKPVEIIEARGLSTYETKAGILKEKGYSTAHASNAEETIKTVTEEDFNMVFTDVKMPVMNGLEIYLVLREIRPWIKVVMMTAYHQERQNLMEEVIGQNVYACLYKPFDTQKLMPSLKKYWLERQKLKFNRWGGD